MSKQVPSRILIILFGAIGDVVRGLSIATRIKREYPDSTICWAVEKTSSGLVKNHSRIDEVLIFDKKKGLSGYISFIRQLRAMQFDITLDLSRHFKGGFTSLMSHAPRRIGFSRKNSREGNWLFQTEHIEDVEHFSDKIYHYQKFADALGCRTEEKISFELTPRPDDVLKIEKLIKDISIKSNITPPLPQHRVLFFIGSTWPSREWPTGHYAELAYLLQNELNMTSIIIGGPGDSERADRIITQAKQRKTDSGSFGLIDITGKSSLSDLQAISTKARLAIGSDSGPMHIASAIGLPVISIWGPTNPLRSTPYGNLQNALQSPIGCAPCYLKECPGLRGICLSSITPNVVLMKVKSIMSTR